MVEPKFPKATEKVANVSTENGSVETQPILDKDPIRVIVTEVVVDSISTESGKLESRR